MIEIKPLERFDPEALLRLVGGYVSGERYAVRKEEARERTAVILERESLERIYVKRWTYQADDHERYEWVVQQGLSLGAYDGGELVGMALAERQDWNRTLWIWEFGVAEAHRRQGVGRRLMEAIAGVARSIGMRVLLCETQNTNVPAIDFYRAVGFELEGIDLSYYTNEDVDEGEVALFMKRKLH